MLSPPSTKMASAGQAHAHSSQPTHFSSPSGCRLSWCLPWKRAAGIFGTSGYSSVATFLNIVEKVTPKPLRGSNSPIAVLLRGAGTVPRVNSGLTGVGPVGCCALGVVAARGLVVGERGAGPEC